MKRPKKEPDSPVNPRKGVFLSLALLFGAALVGDIPRSVPGQRG